MPPRPAVQGDIGGPVHPLGPVDTGGTDAPSLSAGSLEAERQQSKCRGTGDNSPPSHWEAAFSCPPLPPRQPLPPHPHFTFQVLQQEGDLGCPHRPQGSVDPAVEGLQQLQGSDCAFATPVRSCGHHLGEDRREESLLLPEPQLLPGRREGGSSGARELGADRPAAGGQWLHPGRCQSRGRSGIPDGLGQARARCRLLGGSQHWI